jgi:hypothetical protein
MNSDNESKEKTLGSVRGLRRMVKRVSKKDEIAAGVALIIRASKKLAIRAEILEHENKGLRAALIEGKKKRKRGKKMGLFDKEPPGEAQFFSPAKVAAVRERAKEIEAQNESEKAFKEERRLQQALAREKKAYEVQKRKEERIQAQAEKRERLEHEKAQRQAEKLAKRRLREEERTQAEATKVKKNQPKRAHEEQNEEGAKRQKRGVSRSGRQIVLPLRFND